MTSPRNQSSRGDLTSPGIVVANAPVSYGAFEVTVGIDPNAPTDVHVLDEVAAAGYAGIDLGPVGYLGRGPQLRERLASRGLGLAGAYIELPYGDPEALRGAMPILDELLDALDEAGPLGGAPAPRPTLADAGSESRRARPGSDNGMDGPAWRRFGAGLGEVVRRCRDRGYEPTFHFETGTHVAMPAEIERVLEVSDIGLCMDTGHFLLAGGDPVAAIGAWASRINHVHLKDARRSVMAGIIADGAPATAIWDRAAFPALGQGDLDADGVIAALRSIGYSGWLVVEQDTLPRTRAEFDRAAADQRANREFLTRRGL
jgi:inosose dehydratase